jgi:hypothetical protein
VEHALELARREAPVGLDLVVQLLQKLGAVRGSEGLEDAATVDRPQGQLRQGPAREAGHGRCASRSSAARDASDKAYRVSHFPPPSHIRIALDATDAAFPAYR